MASDVGQSLHLSLLGQLFCLLFFLLVAEAFGGCLKLLLVDHEEVAGAPLREIWLRQNVLHARDRAHFPLLIDVLQLVHVVRLVYYAVAFFEMDQLVLWLERIVTILRHGCCPAIGCLLVLGT